MCVCSCRCKCYNRIDIGDRNEINKRFQSFDTKNEQDAYLSSLISVENVKRRRVRKKPNTTAHIKEVQNSGEESFENDGEVDSTKTSKTPRLRDKQFKYRINTSSQTYEVCQNAFLGIHGIKQSRVRRLTSLLKENKSPKDQRGKQKPGNAKSPETILKIIQHINSFPRKQTHYASRVREFLNEKLDITKMFSLFKELHPEEPVNYYYYLKVFREHFSLTFGRPQVDTCLTCEEMAVKLKSKELNETAKRVVAAEKIIHARRAKKFYSKKQELLRLYQNDDSVAVISIDYMQNLSLPQVPIQSAFYLRQLTVNCFCIHNEKTGEATMFLYHEGIGGKGPNEVCSFLKMYLSDEQNVSKEVTKLFIFSDGCGGQNRNHTVVRFFCALAKTQFSEIHHYLPIRGHSFLSCDRDFAVVKRVIKRYDRVYSVREYMRFIIAAANNNRFRVCLVKASDILDFKRWWIAYYKKNTLSIESMGKNVPKNDKRSFKISTYREFYYSQKLPGVIKARNFIDGLLEDTFDLNVNSKTPTPLQFPKNIANPTGVPINKNKIEDLKQFAQYIPPRYMKFYQRIFQWRMTDTIIEEYQTPDD